MKTDRKKWLLRTVVFRKNGIWHTKFLLVTVQDKTTRRREIMTLFRVVLFV